MREARKRAMTWSLVAIGAVMIVLAGVLLATFPWSQRAGFAHFWAQRPAQTQGQDTPQQAPQGPQAGPQAFPPQGWYGYPYGWFMRGPRFFGGGLVVALVLILLVIFLAPGWGYWRYGRTEGSLDAEEILRRTFAEGKITEEEYTRRLSALRK